MGKKLIMKDRGNLGVPALLGEPKQQNNIT
jgi:hypothetical protein